MSSNRYNLGDLDQMTQQQIIESMERSQRSRDVVEIPRATFVALLKAAKRLQEIEDERAN